MIFNQTHVHHATVDFDLLDAGNVIYHPNYLVLCERARNASLKDAGLSFNDLWSQQTAFAVLECNAKFHRAIDLNQKLTILTQTLESSGTTIQVRQRICARDSLAREIGEPGFKTTSIEPPQKDIFFHVDLLLGFVKLNPIKGARIPSELIAALALQKGGQ